MNKPTISILVGAFFSVLPDFMGFLKKDDSYLHIKERHTNLTEGLIIQLLIIISICLYFILNLSNLF